MPIMSKKSREPAPELEQSEGKAFPLRFPDSRTFEALKRYARRTRRSVNMAIVDILERAMEGEAAKSASSTDPPA